MYRVTCLDLFESKFLLAGFSGVLEFASHLPWTFRVVGANTNCSAVSLSFPLSPPLRYLAPDVSHLTDLADGGVRIIIEQAHHRRWTTACGKPKFERNIFAVDGRCCETLSAKTRDSYREAATNNSSKRQTVIYIHVTLCNCGVLNLMLCMTATSLQKISVCEAVLLV